MLGKLSQYPRLRVLIILVILVIVFVVILNLMSGSKSNNTSQLPVSHVKSGKAQAAGPVSQERSQYYQHLNSAVNRQQYRQKVFQGQTVLSNVFNNEATSKSSGHLSASKKMALPSSFKRVSKGSRGPLQRLSALNSMNQADSVFGAGKHSGTTPDQSGKPGGSKNGESMVAVNPSLTVQTEQEAMRNLESTYQNAISRATSSWNLPKMAQTHGVQTQVSKNVAKTVPITHMVVKAGTIYFGVMDTTLNSDQPGTPVLATVVSGPYTGAKLMGTFQREKDRLVVRFNTMSMPQWANTLAINAYAVDANTANNAIATSVNHHYLLRYGMLFASAFLEGFGNAYQSFTYACPPGTASCNIVNSNGLQNNKVTFTTAAYQGLGQLGTNLGQAANTVFNMPPTVKMTQGTGIGVLFMSDIMISQ